MHIRLMEPDDVWLNDKLRGWSIEDASDDCIRDIAAHFPEQRYWTLLLEARHPA